MFEKGQDRCHRCGSDIGDAEERQLRDMCLIDTGGEPTVDDISREVKPIFEPKWGKPQWYELERGGARRRRR
jgi:hypothetical protein